MNDVDDYYRKQTEDQRRQLEERIKQRGGKTDEPDKTTSGWYGLLDFTGHALVIFTSLAILGSINQSPNMTLPLIIGIVIILELAYFVLKKAIVSIREGMRSSSKEPSVKDKIKQSVTETVKTANKKLKTTEEAVKRGSTADELLKWHELKVKGIITAEEFEKRKAKLLEE